MLLRYGLIAIKSREWLDKRFMPWFGPCALLGLLYTIVVMFASQDIISQIGNVARVAVPMLVYFMVMFFASFTLSHWCKMSYESAVTQVGGSWRCSKTARQLSQCAARPSAASAKATAELVVAVRCLDS